MIRFHPRGVIPAATLVAVFGCLVGAWVLAARPRLPRDPIVCRIVSFSPWERAARLYGTRRSAVSDLLVVQDVFEGIEDGRLPRSAIHNPLLVGDAFARVELHNMSGSSAWVQAPEPDSGGPATRVASFGHLFTTVWDETGAEIEFSEWAPTGLKQIALTPPPSRPGADPDPAPEKPMVELPPGRVIRHGFSPLGHISPNVRPRPGRYTVRAVFRYTEASTGAEKKVMSDPITIHITHADIDQWYWWRNR